MELRVLVTNQEPTPLRYRVRFTVESGELVGKPAASTPAELGAKPSPSPAWHLVKTVETEGEVAASASVTATALIPYELLRPGQPYRYRAELLEGSRGAAALPVTLLPAEGSAVATLVVGGAIAVAVDTAMGMNSSASGSGSPALGLPFGSGTMIGTHEAHRVGGEWVEHGSGVIRITGPGGSMVINYTYDSHGASASELTATATGTGTVSRPNKKTVPVEITSATAQMKFPGARQQVGTVVTRTGASATGTYEGVIEGRTYHGVLTMANGTQTLDLATGLGQHSFDIRFTASHP